MDDNELKKAVEKLGEAYVEELINQLLIAGKAASGNLIKSLDYEVVESINGLLLKINSEPYLINVNDGRRKGAKMPPPSAIKKWIDVRGIKGRDKKGRFIKKDQLAFAIARGISKNGIKPTHVLRKTRSKIMKTKDELLGKAASKDVMNALNGILKQFREERKKYKK